MEQQTEWKSVSDREWCCQGSVKHASGIPFQLEDTARKGALVNIFFKISLK